MKNIFTVFILLFSQIGIMQAQMVGTSAYMNGTGVEIGISGEGGFEGVNTSVYPVPGGMHFRSNTQYFGFVANPQANAWATFDGDFFTPGSPENGWGISLGTSASDASNNCELSLGDQTQQVFDIPGSITNYSIVGSCISVDWEGTDNVGGTNLDIKINYLLGQTDLYYTTTIYIKNNTSSTIPAIYYYRNLDPDNNIMLSGSYVTTNTIVSQPGTGGCDIAHVSATQSSPWNSYVGFAAAGSNWRASYGGFCNRDGHNIWTGTGFTQGVGSSQTADIAIQLSYLIQNLAPGVTDTLRYVTILSDADAAKAINTLMYFTYPGWSNVPPTQCTPSSTDTAYTCGGSIPISITGLSIGDYSWTWSPATGLSTTNGTSVIANPAVTTTYTATGTPIVSCMSAAVAFPIVVKVNPNPVSISPSANPICAGSSATLTASGGTSYLWNTSATTSSITVNPATTTTYTVTGTTIGCTTTASVTVTVNSSLTPTISGTPALCSGFSTTLDAGAGYSSYLWNTGPTTETLTVIAAGTYTVTVSTAAGCSGTASVNVTVNSNPPVPTITGTSPICSGGTATLDAGAGYSSYLWNTTATSETIIVSPVVATTYSVTVSNASGCTVMASTVLPVNTSPVPIIAGIPLICSGDTSTLDAGAGYSSYLWSNSLTTQAISVTTSGIYSVTVSNGTGCSGTDSMSVNISVPVVSAGAPVSICPGNSTTLNASGCSTYSWSPASSLSNSSIANPVATPTATTTYTVTGYNGIGCSATNDVVVTLYPKSIPVISSSGQTKFCDTTSISDTLNAGSGYSSYSWSTGATTQTIFVDTLGTYIVTVVDVNGCTFTSAPVNISIEPPMSKPIILSATTPVFCQGDSVKLYVNNPYYSYLWSSGSTPVPDVWAYETETFVVTVTDSLGCTNVSDPFQVTVAPKPDAEASYHNIMLNVSFYDFSSNATSWYWNFGDGLNSTLENPTHTYASAGTYTVILTASDSCGSDNDTLIITVPGPQGIIEYGDGFQDLLVYPVPVSNDVFVAFTATNTSNAELKLFDIVGKLIYEESLSDLHGKYIKSINMSGQAAGMYFIELRSDKSFIVRKFCKQ